MKTIITSFLALFFLMSFSEGHSIEEKNLHKYIKILSSDEFEGRSPGSDGGKKTKKYIKKHFESIGLSPIDNNFYQEVPLSKMIVDLDKSYIKINKKEETIKLLPSKEVVFWTKQVKENISINSSDLVFIGYGIIAPEYNWNDYKNIDVKGKTLVMLVNDPGFETKDNDLFKGKSMTYYGRWVYKFEEAARQGAEAVLIIHETKPAAYPWQVVETSWSGKQIDLKRKDMGKNRIKLEGWITFQTAQNLFKKAGLDLLKLKQLALKRNFQAINMKNLTLNAKIQNSISFSKSHNVVAIKKGLKNPDEFILMMAHWDHLGKRDNNSEEKDNIYNGAVDNATGVAGIMELANYFSSINTDRSLLFLTVTAEESGLLGSQYFAEYPPIDLSNIVAGYNFDGILPIGKTKDVIVVGYGASELEDILKEELDKVGKYISPDPTPEKGSFYRSDHISLAKKGVPVLYADGGIDKIEGGVEAGLKLTQEYTKTNYHQPSDEYRSDWDLSGFTENLMITSRMVKRLANSEEWPKWYDDSEFRSVRESSKNNKN